MKYGPLQRGPVLGHGWIHDYGRQHGGERLEPADPRDRSLLHALSESVELSRLSLTGSSWKTLVVDDEGDVRKSVRLTLTQAGYDVVQAEDGEKGIQQVRSGHHPLMVDAILCEIHMPKVRGEAIAFFRQQFPTVPVIVMTGQPDVNGATRPHEAGRGGLLY